MGFIRHHCIVVTSFEKERLEEVQAQAREIFAKQFKCEMVTEILDSPINGFYTFFVGPDGSKEGWNDSDKGDEAREELTNYLKGAMCYWAEIMYHNEGYELAIVKSNLSDPDEE